MSAKNLKKEEEDIWVDKILWKYEEEPKTETAQGGWMFRLYEVSGHRLVSSYSGKGYFCTV